MNELPEDISDIIDTIATRCRNQIFAYYQSSDIYQEVWRMCLEALDRYDPTRGRLENYLATHVSNRMKNLTRDRYFRPGNTPETSGSAKVQMNLVNALPFDICNDLETATILGSSNIICDNPLDQMICEETVQYIHDNLPDRLKSHFYNLINGDKVHAMVTQELRQVIAEILFDKED